MLAPLSKTAVSTAAGSWKVTKQWRSKEPSAAASASVPKPKASMTPAKAKKSSTLAFVAFGEMFVTSTVRAWFASGTVEKSNGGSSGRLGLRHDASAAASASDAAFGTNAVVWTETSGTVAAQ
eukprot:Amastigsp_a190585_6.p4 type:complete len:123 gc:universal Amastigsp_a190585_6:409-777(+)